jgi:myo-inositol-1(or 4)-monophosphatase
MNAGPDDLDPALLSEIENTAVELAQLGGTEIRAALGSMMLVKYKRIEDDSGHFKDPVSEVDGRVETMIRERLAERFPDHDIIGEEIDHRPGLGHDFLWAVDPIDGTANFINGFPLFASSIGVLYRGRPIVGALWCSTSHGLDPGVYHAAVGSIRFNGAPLDPQTNPAIRRRLAGEPRSSSHSTFGWDGRKTGSAAIECAFVAAGLLDLAWFERPNIWDVAGGLALALAADKQVMVHGRDGWTAFDLFAAGETDPGAWSAPVVLGRAGAVAEFVEAPLS